MKKAIRLEKSIEEQIAQYGEKLLFSEAEYNRDNAEDGGYSNYSYWRSTWRSFTRNRVAMFFMYLLIALMGLLVVKDSMRSWRIHTRKAKMAEVVEDMQEASTNAADSARD